MPVLMIALVALVVFGLIGLLLTIAVVMQRSTLKRAAKGKAAHPAAGR